MLVLFIMVDNVVGMVVLFCGNVELLVAPCVDVDIVGMVVLLCGNEELLVIPCVDVDVVGMVDANVVDAFTSSNDDE